MRFFFEAPLKNTKRVFLSGSNGCFLLLVVVTESHFSHLTREKHDLFFLLIRNVEDILKWQRGMATIAVCVY